MVDSDPENLYFFGLPRKSVKDPKKPYDGESYYEKEEIQELTQKPPKIDSTGFLPCGMPSFNVPFALPLQGCVLPIRIRPCLLLLLARLWCESSDWSFAGQTIRC